MRLLNKQGAIRKRIIKIVLTTSTGALTRVYERTTEGWDYTIMDKNSGDSAKSERTDHQVMLMLALMKNRTVDLDVTRRVKPCDY